ncbi:prepilin-type N-terminal cleavage/methylation domain-containing protein [Pengzhenrongella sp.]|uniref:prepilin-type N-terminal cleavage/methylation domain-containing protein n=1 Tax=Pengzhenrongella sp. TaxID=2888820 RepID=UPI002F93B964
MTAYFRRVRAKAARGDRGVTLIELMVTMLLLAVVSSLVVSAVIQATRVLTHTDDEEKGLADAKVILDRLGRDIRESRAAECDGGLADLGDPLSGDPGCVAHLQLWIDSNSDYLRQASEVVTWRLQKNPVDNHFDVWRTAGTGGIAHRQASSLIVRLAFTYDTGSAATARQVNLKMKYDSIVGRGAAPRWVAFSARLRNKG